MANGCPGVKPYIHGKEYIVGIADKVGCAVRGVKGPAEGFVGAVTIANASPAESGSFSDRLNRLFDTVYPPGRGHYSNIEVVDALAVRGLDLSAPYLSQLRTGSRLRPSHCVMEKLADFFGIRAEYFTGADPNYARAIDAELHWLDVAHDPVVRHLTTALLELAPKAREAAFNAVA